MQATTSFTLCPDTAAAGLCFQTVSDRSCRESNRPRSFRPNFEVIAPDVYVVLSMSYVEFFKMVS